MENSLDIMKLWWWRQWECEKKNNQKKKQNSKLNEQNKNSACFFVDFFSIPAQLRCPMAKFWEQERQGVKYSTISVWTQAQSPLFSSNLNSLLFIRLGLIWKSLKGFFLDNAFLGS